jgi:hypothetical protein
MRADLLQSWLPPELTIHTIVVQALNTSSFYPRYNSCRHYKIDASLSPVSFTNPLINLSCK